MLSRRVLGLLLLVLGAICFAATVFSIGAEIPKEATWIFIPQDELVYQSVPDYKWVGVTLNLNLTNPNAPELQVEFTLTVFNKTRTYGLGLLQPLPVIENRTTALNSMGSASTPITTVTPSGYFTRSQFKFNSFGTPSIWLNVPLRDAITFRKLGEKGTGFTFGSGNGIRGGPEVEQFMQTSDPSVIIDKGMTLSVTYPSGWQLALPDTIPSPDKEFGVGEYRAATWSLNFHEILPTYFVTATLVWSITCQLELRDMLIFLSGVMISLGSSMAIERTARKATDE
jgi:hypothetical protein